MGKAAGRVGSTYAALVRGVEHATWALAGALVLLVSANVFARYVLQMGWLWAEEVSRLVFVWVVFLGSYVALHKKQHMAIEFVVARLSARQRLPATVLARLGVIAFLATMVCWGSSLVLTTLDLGRVTPILGISAAWGYLAVPVAGLLMLLDVLIRGDPTPALRRADGAEPGQRQEGAPG